jgi:hypothetical protein
MVEAVPDSILMRNPERAAWGILLIAFAAFCLSCVLSVLVVHYFFFESTIVMTIEVQPSRGIGGFASSGLSEQILRDRRGLANSRTTLRASAPSQIVLSFRDPYHDEQLIAMLTLKDNTEVDFLTAERPRLFMARSMFSSARIYCVTSNLI